ncbi:GNAT family N-acetyltransferase [Cupriavidus basilensis]|uniref:GNAT family N-acetyltransferase n=2 Tax=Cupriavidus basilensis TaxID=68895 RepID=A0A643FSB8_9BURK|nr:GNAT family N-acetyltransferase [Cupriavidus basilensis]
MPMPVIRLATPEDVPGLPAIERAAAELFPESDLPPALRQQVTPLEDLQHAQRERRLWVAIAPDGTPAGFALASVLGQHACLDEMDVHPAHARRGFGRALVRAVADGLRRQGLQSLHLTTFSHLPWNAPFYASLGFRRLDEADLGPALCAALAREAALGLRQRIAMRLAL